MGAAVKVDDQKQFRALKGLDGFVW